MLDEAEDFSLFDLSVLGKRNHYARAISAEPASADERQGSGSESTRAAGSAFDPSLLTPPVPSATRAADQSPRE
ncbi:hypothetical protein [Sorangium sp. So ce1153]|uniref:hypothetical protein n=1 Tax=Sorangium sp. So ce1153 TaxID=3133333 RepID=UPI003F60AB3C